MVQTNHYNWPLIDEWDISWFDQVNALFNAIDATVYAVSAGSVQDIEGNLKVRGNLLVNSDASAESEDAVIYFSGSANLGAHAQIKWDGTDSRFEFTKNTYFQGGVEVNSVLTVNKSYMIVSGGRHASADGYSPTIYFGGYPSYHYESMSYYHGASQWFEFSKAIYSHGEVIAAGGIRSASSISLDDYVDGAGDYLVRTRGLPTPYTRPNQGGIQLWLSDGVEDANNGIHIIYRNDSGSAHTSIKGVQVLMTTNAGGDITSGWTGFEAQMALQGTGNIKDMHGFRWAGGAYASDHVSNVYGLRLSGIDFAATNAYGIDIGNISGASGVNYAIYTNSGSVRFGDVVTAVNTVNCPELAIDADGRNIGAAMAPFRISGTFRRGVNDSTYGAHMTPTISGNMDGEYAGGLYINTNVNVLNPGSLFGIYDYVNANSLLFNDVTGLFLGFTGLTNTTNVYGIQVGHLIAPASVNKYAIHTGTGSVRFGDVVNMTSNMVLAGSVIGTFKATDLSYFARTILPYQDIDFARFDNTQSWLIHTTGATKRPSLGMIYLDGYCNVGSEWYGISTVGRWDNQGTMSGGTGQFYQNKSLFQYGASVATTATLTGHYIYQQFQTAASGTFTNVYGFRLEQADTSDCVLTNVYGIYLGNIIGNNSYAIYTNSGSVRFGDTVKTTSNLDVDGVAAIGNNASPVSNRLLNIDSLISPTAQYADVFGARIVVDASAYIDGNTVYGLYVNPKYRYFDVITAVVGAYIKPDVTSNVEMGDVRGIEIDMSGMVTPDVQDVFGIRINAIAASAQNENTGLYIQNITNPGPFGGGAYAIYTNAGSVRFGDVVNMTANMVLGGSVIGDLDVVGDITNYGNLTTWGYAGFETDLYLNVGYVNRTSIIRIYGDGSGEYWDLSYTPGIADVISLKYTGTSKLDLKNTGELTVKENLRVNDNAYVGFTAAASDDAVIYFHGSDDTLLWSEASSRFEFSGNVYANGALYISQIYSIGDVNTQTAIRVEYLACASATDAMIYFGKNDAFTKELRWDYSEDEFKFNAALKVDADYINISTAKTPSGSGDTGTQGQVAWDASYIYVCTATNTWGRAALDFDF